MIFVSDQKSVGSREFTNTKQYDLRTHNMVGHLTGNLILNSFCSRSVLESSKGILVVAEGF